MKIETMRKIDYIVGIPLTFLFSLVKYLLPVRRIANKIAPKRVLFIELSEMGSSILADPALQRIQRRHQAIPYFVIFKRNQESLFFLNSVPRENIFLIQDNSLWAILLDSIRFIFWCERQGIEAVIDLELFSRATALLCFISRAPFKVGFHKGTGEGLYRGSFLSHPMTYNSHIHIAKNFIALVDCLYSDYKDSYPRQEVTDREIKIRKVTISNEQKTAVRAAIERAYPKYDGSQKIILINPNASEFLPQRRWPTEYYRELIQMILCNFPNHLILLTGSPAERSEIGELCLKLGTDRCINFAGCLNLLDMPVLYSLSEVLVTNDSGPGHFSSVTEIKSFVFFGPETPALYGSLGNSTPLYANYACSPCVSAANHRKTTCEDNRCLKVLTPERVYPLIKSAIEQSSTVSSHHLPVESALPSLNL